MEEEYPAEDEEAANQCGRQKSMEECDEDGLEDLPSAISRRAGWRDPISRKVSQTSVYLQEWDIPYEQLQLGELIGKVKTVMATKSWRKKREKIIKRLTHLTL